MGKFKIKISGYGCDAIVFPINDEQLSIFIEGDVVEDAMTPEEICEVLDIDDYYGSDTIVNGLYFDNQNLFKSMAIVVNDENDNEVWRTDDNFSFDYDSFETEFIYNEEPYFVVESIEKGEFRVFELETETFNSELLTPVVVELLDGVLELMTTLSYDGVVLEGEFGDTRGTGDNYHIFEY